MRTFPVPGLLNPSRGHVDSQVRRARSESRSKQHRRAVRGGPQGPRSESQPELWTESQAARRIYGPVSSVSVRVESRPVHLPNPPSIDPGIMAFVWALLLALYV